MRYFSEKGQDKWIVEEIFDFKKDGVFVDVGAFDGVSSSNTYVLEKNLRWTGVCIEANDENFEKLKRSRDCICVHACVDDVVGEVRFLNMQGRSGIVANDTDNRPDLKESVFCRAGRAMNKKITENELKKIEKNIVFKQTKTLQQVFNEHNLPKKIDYLSIDTEGAETRILKDFLFDKYKFLAITVERPSDLLHEVFLKNGYIFTRRSRAHNPFDYFYVHKSIKNLNDIKKELYTKPESLENYLKKES